MRLLLTLFVTGALLCTSVTPAAAREPAADPPGELKVDIQVDDIYIRKVLGNKVGELFAKQFQSDDPACRAAAVLVAQEAANNYAYWTTSVDLLKETGKGLELGGKLSGAKTVAKAGQLAFTIAEALEDEEPAAALGRAVTSEASDWLSGMVPKSGTTKIDEEVKKQAGNAKDKLVKALFPGEKKKAKTYSTTVGDCSVSVTPEIEFPSGRNKDDLGGLWLHIDGDCACKKPLRLNSKYSIPTTFHGQSDDVKNCGLGPFAIHAFLPMTRLETSVSYAGTAINLKDLASRSADLKGWIDDKLAGKENNKKPADLVKELGKLTKQATTISPVLRIKPIFANDLELKTALYAKCNECDKPAKPPSPLEEVQSLPDDPCRRRCSKEYDAWIAALTAEAEKRKLFESTEIGKAITGAESELETYKNGLKRDQQRLDRAENTVLGLQDEARRKGFDVRELGDTWTRAVSARDTARDNVQETQNRIKTKERELAGLKSRDKVSQARLDALAKAAATAKAAYEACRIKCKDKPTLIGRWRSEDAGEIYDGSSTVDLNTEGITFEFRAGNEAIFDYSQVKPVVKQHRYGGDTEFITTTTTISGRTTARVRVEGKTISADDIQSSTVAITVKSTDGTAPRTIKPYGFFPFGGQVVEYTLSGDTLTLHFQKPLVFRRVQ